MKNYRIDIMPTAREGLLAIGEHIALDNPVRAISFVDEITDSLKKTLSVFPKSGRVVDGLSIQGTIRLYSYGNYNSYYRVIDDDKLVEILFVFHASRDFEALITQE